MKDEWEKLERSQREFKIFGYRDDGFIKMNFNY